MKKPFSQSCENNKKPILDVIGKYFNNSEMILEIGTGTAQHAIFFAEKLRQLYWQTSDLHENLEGINLRLNEYRHYNLGRPLEIDVEQNNWQIDTCDGIYSANTTHVMNWNMVEKMFTGVSNILALENYFCLYGPFKFNDKYTAESNQIFDKALREKDPESGLKNFDDLQRLAETMGLSFCKRYDLPATNNILVWQQKRRK